MKVSFDFDSTLDRTSVQEYALELTSRGLEVWIVTSRLSDRDVDPAWNYDLYMVADCCKIPYSNIKFTPNADKVQFFNDKDFIWHLDDDWIELNLINKSRKCKTKGISVFGNSVWKNKCEKLLK